MAVNRLALGRIAEEMAAQHFLGLGFQIIARNWRHPEGELDLVVQREGLCVFVEVRSRTGTEFGHAVESVGPQKRSRVLRSARLYLDIEKKFADTYRFDVVAVTFHPDTESPEFLHIEDAFQSNG